MAISLTTSAGNTIDVNVSDGVTATVNTSSTSVSLSQPSVLSVEILAKGPKGDKGDPGDGGGSVLYSNSNETPAAVGGIPQGSTFDDQTMQQMWDALLYPYQEPSFTSFAISGQGNNLECGDTIGPNPTFTWTVSNGDNIEDGSVSITDVTASATVSSGNNYDVSPLATTYAAVGLDAPGSYTFKIQGENTDSETFSRTKSYTFYFNGYAGPNTSETLDEDQIEALQIGGQIGAGTFTLNALSGGYKFFAFPIYPGAFVPDTFKLDNGTNVPMVNNVGSYTTPNGNGFYYDTVSVTNQFDITTDYAVYRTVNILNGQTIIIVS